jgi:hypothetical protein
MQLRLGTNKNKENFANENESNFSHSYFLQLYKISKAAKPSLHFQQHQQICKHAKPQNRMKNKTFCLKYKTVSNT